MDKCEKCLYKENCQFLATHKGAIVEGCTAFKSEADLRADMVREIFEEIDKTLNRKIARSRSRFEKLHRDEKDLSIWGYKDMGYFQGIISTCEDLQDLIDDLKKKYERQ